MKFGQPSAWFERNLWRLRRAQDQDRNQAPPESEPALLAAPPSGSSLLGSVGDLKWVARCHGDDDFWLVANGRFLDPTKYAALFSAIGYTYGQNGTLFALPDARGRTLAAPGGASVRSAGQAVGQETVELTPSNMPAHRHAVMSGNAVVVVGDGGTGLPVFAPSAIGGGGDGEAATTFTTGCAGEGVPVPTLPPTLFVGALMICYA